MVFRDWVGKADWVFANESEAEMLTGTANVGDQMRSLGAQFSHVVIKRGRSGAALGGEGGIGLSQPAPLVNVVDTTGAGDAFAAGFVAALLQGEPHHACLAQGIAKGAEAVQSLGGQPI